MVEPEDLIHQRQGVSLVVHSGSENKVRNSIGQLFVMKKFMPKKLGTTIYNAIVNSQLSYAIAVWGGTENNLQKQ